VTNEGVKRLGDSLTKLIAVKDLNLDFLMNEVVEDEGVNSICNALETLDQLEVISIGLVACWKITKAGFERLGEALKAKKETQEIYVDFRQIPDYHDDKVKVLFEELKKNPSIRILSILGFYLEKN